MLGRPPTGYDEPYGMSFTVADVCGGRELVTPVQSAGRQTLETRGEDSWACTWVSNRVSDTGCQLKRIEVEAPLDEFPVQATFEYLDDDSSWEVCRLIPAQTMPRSFLVHTTDGCGESRTGLSPSRWRLPRSANGSARPTFDDPDGVSITGESVLPAPQ